MEVEDVLPATSFHVEYQFIAGVMDSQFLCDFLCPEDEFRNHGAVFIGQVVDTPDVILGHQKDVNRRMGFDVSKGNDRFPLVDNLCRFFTPDDLAENTVFHFNSLLCFLNPPGLQRPFSRNPGKVFEKVFL
jgi:hypothetical protein